jgi:hypothetical protein
LCISALLLRKRTRVLARRAICPAECSIIYFGNRCEFGSIKTPKQKPCVITEPLEFSSSTRPARVLEFKEDKDNERIISPWLALRQSGVSVYAGLFGALKTSKTHIASLQARRAGTV